MAGRSTTSTRGTRRAQVRDAALDPVDEVQRVEPRCRHFGPCGGCAWQHIAYAEQLRLKRQCVQGLLDEALGPGAASVEPTLPTPPGDQRLSVPPGGDPEAPWHYRNKVNFVFGPGARGRGLVMGHYARGSRVVIPVAECPVHAAQGNRVAFALRDVLERCAIPGATSDVTAGIARHVVVRVAGAASDYLVTLVVTENVKALRRVSGQFVRFAEDDRAGGTAGRRWGLYLNVHDRPGALLFGRETRHLAGAREIREVVAGVSFLLSPASFFQTNVRAAHVLAAEVLGALADRSCRRILDLYAGVGLFALPLAREGRLVTAVEENRDAMAAASAARRENRIDEGACQMLAAPVESVMARLTPRAARDAWDAVVIDPPREGCQGAVLDWVFRTLRPHRAVYVSCNPEALARDLGRVAAAGYRPVRIQPIDMFPHTAHVETVVVLEPRTAGTTAVGPASVPAAHRRQGRRRH